MMLIPKPILLSRQHAEEHAHEEHEKEFGGIALLENDNSKAGSSNVKAVALNDSVDSKEEEREKMLQKVEY